MDIREIRKITANLVREFGKAEALIGRGLQMGELMKIEAGDERRKTREELEYSKGQIRAAYRAFQAYPYLPIQNLENGKIKEDRLINREDE